MFMTVACSLTLSYSFCISPVPVNLSTNLSLRLCNLDENRREYVCEFYLALADETYGLPHGKTNNLHMRKQRCRSASP